MNKLWELEGKDTDTERKTEAKTSGPGKKPYVVGFGQRVTALKTQIIKATVSKARPKDTALMALSDVPLPGTPPDNKSITSYFGKK